VRERILSSEILIVASPTWLGRPSSVAQRAPERMDAMLSETDEEGPPVAYNRVAGVVPSYLDNDRKHDRSQSTGHMAATNLLGVARALAANPLPAPPS
jgi:multimeric flavodoxin WrbA